jgi:hypothetical protein
MDVSKLINEVIFSQNSNLNIYSLLLSLVCATLLSLVPVKIYQIRKPGGQYTDSFLQSLLVFTLLSTVITLVIGSNFARAFGLVGVLSIIRFRTALKSPIDAVFTFWSLTIGVACGTSNFLAAFLLCIFVGVVYLISPFILKIGPKHKDIFIKLVCSSVFVDEVKLAMNSFDIDIINEYKILDEGKTTLVLHTRSTKQGLLDELQTKVKGIDKSCVITFEEGIQPQVYAY